MGVPALFFSNPKHNGLQDVPDHDIVIFDVTPINIEKCNPYNLSYYYGRYETAIALVRDALWAAETVSNNNKVGGLKIALKPKRKNHNFSDLKYFEDLNSLEKKHLNFTVLSDKTDLGELFHPRTIFISRPFTSAAHLAAINGSLSIYHDPNGEIADTSVKMKNLIFTSGKEKLAEVLGKLIYHARNQKY